MRHQGFDQIAVAAPMNGLFGIEVAKGRLAARRQQEVVYAHAVLHDFEHRTRAVRPEAMARGQPDRLLIIEGPAVRQRLARVGGHEGDHVADLAAFGVDDLQNVAVAHGQRGTAARRNFDRHGSALGSRNGHVQPSSTMRPLYCAASLASP